MLHILGEEKLLQVIILCSEGILFCWSHFKWACSYILQWFIWFLYLILVWPLSHCPCLITSQNPNKTPNIWLGAKTRNRPHTIIWATFFKRCCVFLFIETPIWMIRFHLTCKLQITQVHAAASFRLCRRLLHLFKHSGVVEETEDWEMLQIKHLMAKDHKPVSKWEGCCCLNSNGSSSNVLK